MACEAMRKNFREQCGEAGRFELCYLDAPNRDGKGAVRLLDLPSDIPGDERSIPRNVEVVDVCRPACALCCTNDTPARSSKVQPNNPSVIHAH